MRRKISATRSHYHPPTGSSTTSIPFRPPDWSETQRVNALFKRGLQQDGEFEKAWPAVLDTLIDETYHVTAWRCSVNHNLSKKR
jgi:hypothetical protein